MKYIIGLGNFYLQFPFPSLISERHRPPPFAKVASLPPPHRAVVFPIDDVNRTAWDEIQTALPTARPVEKMDKFQGPSFVVHDNHTSVEIAAGLLDQRLPLHDRPVFFYEVLRSDIVAPVDHGDKQCHRNHEHKRTTASAALSFFLLHRNTPYWCKHGQTGMLIFFFKNANTPAQTKRTIS